MSTIATIQSAIDVTYLSVGSRKMARASDGRLWCVFVDKANGTRDVKVAYSDNGGTTWTAETVKVGVNSISDSALAIDSTGAIHVVWSERTTVPSEVWLFYRNRTSAGVWSSVATLFNVATYSASLYPDVAVDSVDDVHVAYIDYTTVWRLNYTKRTSGTWGSSSALVTGDASGDNIESPSIAIDSTNYPHIVYLHEKNPGGVKTHYVYYIYQTVAGWQTAEEVASSSSIIYTPSMVLDSSNDIYVVWSEYGSVANPTFYQVYYRKRTAGVWGTETLIADKDNNQGGGIPIGISITSTSVVHFVWSGKGWGTNTTKWSIQHRPLTSGVLGDQDDLVNDTLERYVSASLWARYPTTDILSFGYKLIFFSQTATGWDLRFYGSSLATFPSEAITRVTALVHRYDRKAGVYQLEISLGDLTSTMALPYDLTGRRATAEAKQEQDAEPIIEEAVRQSRAHPEKYTEFFGPAPGVVGRPVLPQTTEERIVSIRKQIVSYLESLPAWYKNALEDYFRRLRGGGER